MTVEPPSPERLTSIRAAVIRNPGTPAAPIIRLLLAEVDRLTAAVVAPCPLSRAQMPVLVGLANGEDLDTTARRLHLSPHTVKSHRLNIYKQLAVGCASHAVAVAMACRWIEPDAVRIPDRSRAPVRKRPGPAPRPKPESRPQVHRRHAAELRSRPGEWGAVGSYRSGASARQTAHRIRTGEFTAYTPAGSYEAEHIAREGAFIVRVRYVGTPSRDTKKAAS